MPVIVSQLGVADVTKVLVVDVTPNSPAETAGLQVGDLILDIDGIKIDHMNTLHETIYAKLDKEVHLTYLRGKTAQRPR